MATTDIAHFLRAWLAEPLRVGAIAPSSAALADLITSEITAASAPVLELGAGTGVFTSALLARGLDKSDLTLIEVGEDFARLLELRFPGARVLRVDAARLKGLETDRMGAVVSGLPLLSMKSRKVMAILVGAFAHLRPDGAFYQFTYGPSCPVPGRILDRLGLKAARIGWTVRNMPPAAVYRITRREPILPESDL